MPQFNPEDYEPVADRVPRFWADHPQGRIRTEMLVNTNEHVVFLAELFREGQLVPFANGYASEVPGQGPVNRTSALENCETSAIGRALANAGYSAKAMPRPSREEMVKTQAPAKKKAGKAPAKPHQRVDQTTGEVVPDGRDKLDELVQQVLADDLTPAEFAAGLKAYANAGTVAELDDEQRQKLTAALGDSERRTKFVGYALDAFAAQQEKAEATT